MGRLLVMDAYIANVQTHDNVMSLGDWYIGVCIDAGIVAASDSRIPDGQYDYFASLVDDILTFGGHIQISGYGSQMANVEKIRQYVPLVNNKTVPAEYATSAYCLKLVNANGDYALSTAFNATGTGIFAVYNSGGGESIGSVPLSVNSYNINNNHNVSWFGFVVSAFASDGKFDISARYTNINVNSSRYITKSNFTPNQYIIDFLNNIKSYTPPSTDPFGPGGESEPGGGTGDFDGTSDPIDFPPLPELSAVDTGFICLFIPTIAQLQALGAYMWSDSLFDLDTWKKIFADPMDAILGLSIVPVSVPSAGGAFVNVGNMPTNITMYRASAQYVEVDCGSLNVNEFWGAYLDYSPYTKAEIYLPYIGTHAINVDDIMGKNIHVKYHVDILSGACAAYIKCGDSVLYTFIGQCASSIPITGNDWTNVINGAISAAVSIGSMVATGGATAPLAVPALANTAANGGMKPEIEKSGSLSGTGGMLGIQKPYLILTRPNQCLPAAQNEYMGYPSFISSVMGDLSGYTEVEQVHLDGIAATDAEISEIENLLKSGVIF